MSALSGERSIAVAFLLFSAMCLAAAPQATSHSDDPPASLDIQPSVLVMRPGDTVQLVVKRTSRDGSTVDLTRSAKTTYVSQDPTVATVTSHGAVKAVAPGDTNIVVNGKVQVPVTVQGPMSVAPSGVALHPSETEQFIAMAMDASPSVTWSVDIGSIGETGMYTAPASIDKQQTANVTAKSATDPNLSASVKVTLYPPVSMMLNPSAVTLRPAQTQQFTAKAANAGDTSVNWSIRPSGMGSINESGLYTAPPSVASQQTVTVTATSLIDKTKSASATVTLRPAP
jgi:hypothetical protein